MDNSVTFRDGYVIRKALMYAIAFVDRLPLEEQEQSDRDDMMQILDRLLPVDNNWRQIEQANIARKLDDLTTNSAPPTLHKRGAE